VTEEFTWRVNTDSGGGPEFTALQIQFADQYAQQGVVDINSEINKWTVVVSGDTTKMLSIISFLRRNKATPFLWKPPLADLGTFTLEGSYKIVNVGGMQFTITMDFLQCYGALEVEAPPVLESNLQIIKVADTLAPAVGANITFTITVTNNGPDSAIGIVVSDLLADGYAFVSATPSVGTYDDVTGEWSGIGTLANTESVTLEIVATVLSTGSYENTATVTSVSVDPESEDNISTITPSPIDLTLVASSLLEILRSWFDLEDSTVDGWGPNPLTDERLTPAYVDAPPFGRAISTGNVRSAYNLPNWANGKDFFMIAMVRQASFFVDPSVICFLYQDGSNESISIGENSTGFVARGLNGGTVYAATSSDTVAEWTMIVTQHLATGEIIKHVNDVMDVDIATGNVNLNPTQSVGIGAVGAAISSPANVAFMAFGLGVINQDQLSYCYDGGNGKTISDIISDASYSLPACRMSDSYPGISKLNTSYDGLSLAMINTSGVTRGNFCNTSRGSGLYWFAVRNFAQLTGGTYTTSIGIFDAAAANAMVVRVGGAFQGQVNVGGSFTDGTDPGSITGIAGPEDWIMLALNANTKKVWVGKNNVWSGDPVAGTGESCTYTGALDLFPVVTSAENTFGCEMAFTSDRMPYASPTGFTPWGD